MACDALDRKGLMRDGLYIVKTKYFYAGFTVVNGKVSKCAPILRKKIDYWKTKAIAAGP